MLSWIVFSCKTIEAPVVPFFQTKHMGQNTAVEIRDGSLVQREHLKHELVHFHYFLWVNIAPRRLIALSV